MYVDMLPQKEKCEWCVREKMKKMMAKNEHNAQKGAELKFGEHQYLYISE